MTDGTEGSEWSAAQYLAFEAERTRPVYELLARVNNREVAYAADIGCGPGNSTAVLRQQFPHAAIIGLDSSADMIAAARARLPDIHFELGDIRPWCDTGGTFDLILANAVLQWLPDHAALLASLLGKLAPLGSLAVQMPDNLEEPAHLAMRKVAADGPWADRLAAAAAARTVIHDAEWYFRALRALHAGVEIWRTTYYHPLGGAAAVISWLKGTGLRPYLARLAAGERGDFLACLEAEIAQAYPTAADGTLLLPFPRLFFVANRTG
ncbi:trans-aconitate 2-methyltransferase [Lichenicoccus sp.]|uniref:trans-aconitate 2-methyltransferase n=1 Tax=Lichenicoccus sp. TaxID=2781899 RepID=UPI003D0DAE8A